MSFHVRFNTVKPTVQIRGKAILHFRKPGVKIEALKNKGKTAIGF